MKKMMKIELERALKSKMFIVSILIGLCIVAFDIMNNIIPQRYALDEFIKMGEEAYTEIQLPGLYMQWMGVRPGTYIFLYYFIMPLLTALPYSVSIIMDVRKRYINNIFTRINKKEYYKAKLFTQFITGGLVATVPLIVSYIASAMILPAYKPLVVTGQYVFREKHVVGRLFYNNPFAVAIIIFLSVFIGFGLINCIAYIFADLVNNRFMVALTPFIAYFFMYVMCTVADRVAPMQYIGIVNLEYSGVIYMFIDTVILLVAIILSYIVRSRRKDEI